jgi:RND family efflux transporter MFP subunit
MNQRLTRDLSGTIPILLALLATMVHPATVHAFDGKKQTGGVIASAVVVPAQISRMGFLIAAPVKEVTVKAGDIVQSGQTLVVLNTPDLAYAVTAADAAYRSAEANAELQRYKRVKDIRNGKIFWDVVHPEVRQLADGQALQAKVAMEIAQATLDQNTLTAPYAGTIASVDVIPGEFVQQGQAIIALATLDNLIIETTDLSERDILKVSVGDPAAVFVDSLNETISGKVIRIAPKADVVGGDVVFTVTIALDKQPKGLFWGMTAEVTIGK